MNTKFLMTLLLLLFSSIVIAQTPSPAIAVKYFETKDGAIRGYDPVAYFKESKAVKGDLQFSLKWSGTDWYLKTGKTGIPLKWILKNMHHSMAAIALMV